MKSAKNCFAFITFQSTKMAIDKKISLDLTELDWNAFALMWGFQRQARREWRTKEEIDEVLTEAKNGDYGHLVVTLDSYCE